MRRGATRGVVAAALIWMLIWTLARTAPPAVADPAGEAATDTAAISLADLGSNGNVVFSVTQASAGATVAFPVPIGLVPTSLKARLELPIKLRYGSLAVRQGERTISRQLLPDQDQQEMVIPLDGLQTSGGWVNLTLAMTALPLEDYCWDPRSPIRLADVAVTFSGAVRPPTSVADFLPAALRRVTIAVPAKPSQGETAAAVQTAAAVANRNGQKPEVAVVRLPDGAAALPPAADPLERQIIVKEGPRKGLSLQGSALLISGPANELADQARLLGDDAARYALSTNAVPQTLPEPILEGDNTTVEQMLGRALGTEAASPQVIVPIDQSRWGHPLGAVTVRLIGSYTPVPPGFGGEVIVSVGGQALENSPNAFLGSGLTLARWPADDTGTIDRTVTIPDRLLKRFIGLEVAVRVTGDPGHCGDYFPALLKIDGATTISVQRSNPPAPQGFQSLPQSLMTPRVRFGIGSDAFGDTVRAVQIVVGLQQSSAVPLFVDVTDLDSAINSADPAVLIAADGWQGKPIALPFNVDQGKVEVTGVDADQQPVTMTLDPARGFGSLQTVSDGRRTVLVATSTGDGRLLDELLRYLAAQPGRWAGLDGSAIISTPGAQPITIAGPRGDYPQAPPTEGAAREDGWFWWALGGVAVVAALGALTILLRARRQSPAG